MINYPPGSLGFNLLCTLKGSVFPKSLALALSNGVLAFVLHSYRAGSDFATVEGGDVLWSSYTFVLGVLIVFRTNIAYSRFWEGATLLQQVRGEWFNAYSSLIAFSNSDSDKRDMVYDFQNLLVRLMSMLHCAALQTVCNLHDDTLEIIDLEGMDATSLQFLDDSHDRCEIILQWIQRLLVEAEDSKVLKIAPPILSRVYQELSRGVVNLHNAGKIKEIPFPFPYAQMICSMMIVHWLVTPVLACHFIESKWFASIMSFLVSSGLWSLVCIAAEIDHPFGDDVNHLPLRSMQQDMNRSLTSLLQPLAQRPPAFTTTAPYQWESSNTGSSSGDGSATQTHSKRSTFAQSLQARYVQSDHFLHGLVEREREQADEITVGQHGSLQAVPREVVRLSGSMVSSIANLRRSRRLSEQRRVSDNNLRRNCSGGSARDSSISHSSSLWTCETPREIDIAQLSPAASPEHAREQAASRSSSKQARNAGHQLSAALPSSDNTVEL